MSLFCAIKSAIGGAGQWIQEAYCSVGQKIGERLEQISDSVAEKRYLAQRRPEQPGRSHAPIRPVIELSDYRVINGHKHAN